MPTNDQKKQYMAEALKLAVESAKHGTGPFGAVVVKNGAIIGRGWNQVTSLNDPTAHAEVMAVREACKTLNSFQLIGCDIYTSCEPCPMCLGTIYWARPEKVYYMNTREEAAAIGFDDQFIYDEINLANKDRKWSMERILTDKPLAAFEAWEHKIDKIRY